MYRSRKQHPISFMLSAAANGASPTAWPSSPGHQQPPQRCSVNMLQAHKSKNLKVSQSSNPWAATCATSP